MSKNNLKLINEEITKEEKALKKQTLNKVKTSNTQKTKVTKKNPSKKNNLKSSNNRNSEAKNYTVLEYYDLPYKYDKTIIKVLAQTPNTLFVYWEISDLDKNNFVEKYGSDFFEKTKPVLIVHNRTKNYSFEFEINDFANSWYFNVDDASSKYSVELGRRPKFNNTNVLNNYFFVTSSNTIEAPNNHVLVNNNVPSIKFKNIKTNDFFSKEISTLQFLPQLEKLYENINIEQFKLDNPSSNFNDI